MRQIASSLVWLLFLLGLWSVMSSWEGGLIHETKLPMQELELKMRGGGGGGGGGGGVMREERA